MIISNLKVYDLEETLVASGYAMVDSYNENTIKDEQNTLIMDNLVEEIEKNKHFKRAERLTKADLNSGHPNFLSGIVVSMDVTFTNKVWVEWQRYHFQQIVTSQSTMHKLSKMSLDDCFIEYTDTLMVERLKEIQQEYNDSPTRENYLKLVYSCPSGLKLTARVTTNYLQLMTMYKQRSNHRLPEWREFTEELKEQLPYFKHFLKVNGIE